ncbi:MAG: hypothetical protein QXI32_01050 [Candidatus Bathyarchaeia archaeon]
MSTPTNLKISMEPSSLKPGKANNVLFFVNNTGEVEAEKIFIVVNLPSPQAGVAPMILLNSDGKHFVESLTYGKTINVSEQIYVSPSAAGNLYTLTLTMTYTSEGEPRTETRTLGVTVELLPSTGGVLSARLLPYRLGVGENELTLRLDNVGDMDVYGVSVSITMPYAASGASPIALVNSDGRYTFSKIEINGSVSIPLKVYVTQSAPGQLYQVNVALTYSDSIRTKSESRFLTLDVPAVFSPSAVIDIMTDKTELRSGEVNNLTLIVKNIGDGPADALNVQLAFPSTQLGSQALTLLGSDGMWSFGKLEPGGEARAALKIFAAPAASGNTATLTVTSSYVDMGYKPKQQVSYLGIIVRGSVNLTVLGTSTFPTSITPGAPFSLTINFINLGTATAQSVIFTPSETSCLKPLSKDRIFLGDLTVNTPSSMTISYRAINVTSGEQNISLPYTFKDSLGCSFSDSLKVTFYLNVATETSPKTVAPSWIQAGNIQATILMTAIVALVVAGLVILFKRRKTG